MFEGRLTILLLHLAYMVQKKMLSTHSTGSLNSMAT